jgi:hypothetical protein
LYLGVATAFAFAAVLTVLFDQLHAQSTDRAESIDPTKLPLLEQSDLRYLGAFAVDPTDGTDGNEGRLTWGGRALSVNPTTNTLMMSGHDHHGRMCEVSIPSDFERGTRAVQPCVDVAEGRLKEIDEGSISLGGSLIFRGRLIVSAYSYYDADNNQERSHFVSGLNLSQAGDVQGPFRVGKDQEAGFVSGYMGHVPEEWQELLGGPALTGNCCLTIISRTSSGPAVSAFNPDDLGKENKVRAAELLGYPLSDALARGDSKNLLFNLTTAIKGVALPAGTRSVLFIGAIGEGDYCYGELRQCPDPAGGSKGPHMYPYRHQVWAYDANDLADVKRGRKRPWEPRPYATWHITDMNDRGTASIAGAAYDQTTRRLYVTEHYGDHPRVHVYEIAEKK